MSAASNFSFSPKISGSGSKVIEVPVPRAGPSALSGLVGLPRPYVCTCRLPSRLISTTSLRARALTTELPTPCRPPEWM